ncbi:MAG: hypothetical protein ACREMB_27070 [Candidatus Rokuibacteriota bacterium]
MALLLQPLGPFVLAILVGLTAGAVAEARHSLLVFAGSVVLGAVAVGMLDLFAHARVRWQEVSDGLDGVRAPLAGVVWDQVSANLVVIGVVGLLTYLTLRLT